MSYDKILHAVTDPLTLAALALLLTAGLIARAHRSLSEAQRSRRFNALIGLAALFVVGAFVLVAFQLAQQMQASNGTTQTVGTGNAVSGVGGSVSIGGGSQEPTKASMPAASAPMPLPSPGRVDQHVESGNAITNVGGNVRIQGSATTPDGKPR